MRSGKTYLLILFCLTLSFTVLAQNGNGGGSSNYTENYYLYPVSPGSVNTLAGTMGELRSTHFHSGIDVRTGGVQGKAVLASADGFISRININPGGYGNALYLQHPNGQTTVYAHLKEFSPEIQQYVTEQQYQKQSFRINLFPQKGQFSFHRGDTIALSGNSGSSGGPHLHFDIRDENQKVLNPLKYGFKEVIDTRSPEARMISFKTMDINSRINGQFGKFDFPLKRSGRNYTTESPIGAFGKIGIQLFAFDRQDYTRFRTGIYRITMEIDGYLVYDQKIDTYAFSEGRNFYVHVDYEELRKTGRRYHRLYVGDGNDLKFYQTNHDRGLITFTDHCEHDVDILMEDSYGNTSKVLLKVYCEPPVSEIKTLDEEQFKETLEFEKVENTLVLKANMSDLDSSSTAKFYDKGLIIEKNASYKVDNNWIYLWDLTKGLPDSVEVCSKYLSIPFNVTVPSESSYTYYNDHMDIEFRRRTLFDTAYVDFHYEIDTASKNEIYTIGKDIYPFRRSMKVSLKPSKIYNPENARVYTVGRKGSYSFVGGEWDNGKLIFSSRNFGKYTILEDSVAPTVKPLIINSDGLVFRINDNSSGIKDYKVLVNNEWVLMYYDPKLRRIWSKKLDPSKPFKGAIVLSVRDNADNEKIYKTKIQ